MSSKYGLVDVFMEDKDGNPIASRRIPVPFYPQVAPMIAAAEARILHAGLARRRELYASGHQQQAIDEENEQLKKFRFVVADVVVNAPTTDPCWREAYGVSMDGEV